MGINKKVNRLTYSLCDPARACSEFRKFKPGTFPICNRDYSIQLSVELKMNLYNKKSEPFLIRFVTPPEPVPISEIQT